MRTLFRQSNIFWLSLYIGMAYFVVPTWFTLSFFLVRMIHIWVDFYSKPWTRKIMNTKSLTFFIPIDANTHLVVWKYGTKTYKKKCSHRHVHCWCSDCSHRGVHYWRSHYSHRGIQCSLSFMELGHKTLKKYVLM